MSRENLMGGSNDLHPPIDPATDPPMRNICIQLWGCTSHKWVGVGWVSGGSTHPVRLPISKGLAACMGGCWGVFAKKSKKRKKGNEIAEKPIASAQRTIVGHSRWRETAKKLRIYASPEPLAVVLDDLVFIGDHELLNLLLHIVLI